MPRLAGERRLGAHFGFLASAGGLAVLVGSTGVGALLDRADTAQPGAAVPWVVLAVFPAASASGLWLLARRVDRHRGSDRTGLAPAVPVGAGDAPGGGPRAVARATEQAPGSTGG